MREGSRVTVVGAGIAGLWQALLLSRAGFDVAVHERGEASMRQAASHWAGGMLAPWCEGESAEPVIARLGRRSLELWREAFPDTRLDGTLVVAHARDRADLERFAALTEGHERIDGARIAALEPALAGRFRDGLFFPGEGHVEPRRALPALREALGARGVSIRFGSGPDPAALGGIVVDCRGLAARESGAPLRGVKGETALVETGEITLSRPVRLIHPRWPLYIVPRAGGRFLIGATTVEAEDEGVTVRAALELLTAAYAVHPAFAEARIVELGAGLRPAFADNLPRIAVEGDRLAVNGLYRHGFLVAPALAELCVAYLRDGRIDNEVMQWS